MAPIPTNWTPCGSAAFGTEQAKSLGDMFRPFLPATQRPRVLLPHLQCTPAGMSSLMVGLVLGLGLSRQCGAR